MPWSGRKIGPTLSCKQSTASKAANGVCRCGPALISQTGKRPSRPYNWLSWSTKAATRQAAWGKAAWAGHRQHRGRKKHDNKNSKAAADREACDPGRVRLGAGRLVQSAADGAESQSSLCGHAHALFPTRHMHLKRVAAHAPMRCPQKGRVRASMTISGHPCFFFLGVTRVGLVHSSSLN